MLTHPPYYCYEDMEKAEHTELSDTPSGRLAVREIIILNSGSRKK